VNTSTKLTHKTLVTISIFTGSGWTNPKPKDNVILRFNSELVKVEHTIDSIVDSATPREELGELKKVSATLPTYVDYRESGDVSSIKSQGSCGCCWSFTTVGTYESWMMLKGEQEYDLSEQYLLECTTLFTKNVKKVDAPSTCNGGYVDYSGELARVNGMPTEEKFPYIAANYTGSVFPNTPGICDAN
jgi:C1A family cysteine protease